MKLPYRTEINANAVSRIWNKSLDTPDWWRAESSGDTEEILLYDYVGWPFNDPYDLAQHLQSLNGKDVTFRINSPGGDVFDGLTIYSFMREYKGRITTKIEGLAASMASVIALGGSEVQAHKHAMYMMHEPLVLTVGNQHELRELADLLQKMTVNFVDIYSEKVGGKKRDIQGKMKDETWMTAAEAKEFGFVDTVLDLPRAQAGFDLSMFAKVPEEIQPEPKEEPTVRNYERALREAGMSRSQAKALLARGQQSDSDNKIKELEALASAQQFLIKMKG
ncbi:MAG: Clp protease ClpP [Verrucomicrobiae bacterium]|nr:Clp protease ClpP [Verrucomicrobiae bacterium]